MPLASISPTPLSHRTFYLPLLLVMLSPSLHILSWLPLLTTDPFVNSLPSSTILLLLPFFHSFLKQLCRNPLPVAPSDTTCLLPGILYSG